MEEAFQNRKSMVFNKKKIEICFSHTPHTHIKSFHQLFTIGDTSMEDLSVSNLHPCLIT